MAARKMAATKVAPKGVRRYADGGELRSVRVTPREEEPPPRKQKEEEPSMMDRAKRVFGIGGKPTIEGGLQNLIKKRGDRIDEATGVKAVEKARGGKIRKR